MNRKVLYAKLQTRAFLPGAGDLGDVFPSPNKALDNLSMVSYGADGLTVSFTYRGIKKEMWVPSSNVAFADLAPEPSPVATSIKVAKAS